MKRLSSNPSLDFSFVEENPEGLNGQPWDMQELSLNSNLSWQIVVNNPNGFGDVHWNSYSISFISFEGSVPGRRTKRA